MLISIPVWQNIIIKINAVIAYTIFVKRYCSIR